MASNNFMRCDTDTGFEDSPQLTTPTLHYYMPKEKNKGAIKDSNSSLGHVGVTSPFSTVYAAKPLYTSSWESFDSEETPRPPFTPTDGSAQSAQVDRYNGGDSKVHSAQITQYNEGGVAVHSAQLNRYNEGGLAARSAQADIYTEGGVAVHSADVILYNRGQSTSNVVALPRNNERQLIRKPRHCRANSSISTISMSGIPEFMSTGQLLSPSGLSATSRLFDQADSSDNAKVYALRGEEINVGLGLINVNVLTGPVECDDVYQFVHSEESGGIPVTQVKKGGKKRRRDVTDIDGECDGDFVAVSRYHLDDEDESSSSEDDDEGIAQGGALLEVAPTPFPEFDEMKAALLEAAGEVYYTMPIGPMIPGTMEYVQQVRSRG